MKTYKTRQRERAFSTPVFTLSQFLWLALACFVLGVSVVMMGIVIPMRQQPAPAVTRIVCESGSEVPVKRNEDPYLVWTATCNVNDATGRPIQVLMID